MIGSAPAWALDAGSSRHGAGCLALLHVLALLGLGIALAQLFDRISLPPAPVAPPDYTDGVTASTAAPPAGTPVRDGFWLVMTLLISLVSITGVLKSLRYHLRGVTTGQRIVFHNDGAIQVFTAPASATTSPRDHPRAVLRSPAIVNRWMITLKLQDTGNRSHHLVIWRDSVSDEDYRHLSSTLRAWME